MKQKRTKKFSRSTCRTEIFSRKTHWSNRPGFRNPSHFSSIEYGGPRNERQNRGSFPAVRNRISLRSERDQRPREQRAVLSSSQLPLSKRWFNCPSLRRKWRNSFWSCVRRGRSQLARDSGLQRHKQALRGHNEQAPLRRREQTFRA